MAENQMDGGSAEGTVTDANGDASVQQSDKQPSFDAAKLQETFDAFGHQLEELTARVNGLQSVKDKDKQELKGLKARIAEYEDLKERFGADGAIEQIELKQTLSEMKEQLSKLNSTSTPGPGTVQGGAVDAAKVVAEYGLDPKDPQVALIVNGKYNSQDQVELAVARHIKSLRNAPSPTPAQAPVEPGKVSPPANVEELTQEYIQKMQAARGNRSEVQRLRNEYKQKGVNIYAQDFS